jgi:uncharacterized protein (DUF2164 family)
MADDKKPGGSILGREPNSLDKIGSKSYTQGYMDQLAMMERRAAIETVEMRRLRQRMDELEQSRLANIRNQANVRAGVVSPTESMFRGVGLSEAATREVFKNIAPGQMPTAFVRASERYNQDLQAKASEINERLNKMNELRQVNAMRQFTAAGISSAGSESGISSLQRDPGVMSRAMRYASVATDTELGRGLERARASRRSAAFGLEESLADVTTPEGRQAYLQRAQSFEEAKRKEASLMAAVSIQRRQGRDISGQMAGSESIEARILSEARSRGISSYVASGGAGSLKEETSKLRSAEEQFIASLDKFRREFEKTGDVTKEVREELGKNKEAYEDQKKIVDEVNRSGGGGGNFGRFVRGARVATGLASYGFVNADIEQTQLRAASASSFNREFLDYMSAGSGDVSALRRITTGAYERSRSAAATYGSRAVGAQGADVTLGGIQAGLDFISGNLGAAASGAADITKSGIDLGKGLIRARAEQAGLQAQEELDRAVNAIPDTAKQRFLDFRLGTFNNLMGTGSAMSRMYGQAVSGQALSRYAEFGFSPEQGAALYGTGANLIGSQFTRNQGRADEISRRAMMLESRGVMSAQQYMANVGQFTQAGGTEKDFEDLLASAVARGVDDAKSLSGLAQSVQNLAVESAGRGIGTASIVSQQMQIGMQQLEGLGRDETLKQNLIQRGLSNFSKMASSVGMDIPTMQTMSALSDLGLSDAAAAQIAGAEIEDIQALNKELLAKGYKKGQKLSRADVSGLGEQAQLFVDDQGGYRGKDFIEKVRSLKLKYQIGTRLEMIAGAANASPERISRIREQIEKGGVESLSIADLALYQTVTGESSAAYSGFVGKGEVKRKDASDLTGGAAEALKSKKGMSGILGNIITQAGEFAGGMENLAKELANKFTEAAASTNVYGGAVEAAQAAEKITLDIPKFNGSVNDFGNAVNNFDKAVDRLLKEATPATMIDFAKTVSESSPVINRRSGTSKWDWTSGNKF